MANLGNPSGTIEILQKYNFNFQKKFGQNFLIDPRVLDKIIDAAEITEDDMVLEIGPGIGTNVLHKGGDRNDYYRESLPQMFPLEHFPKGVIPIYLPLSMLFPTLMVWRKAYCDCLTTSVVKYSHLGG